MIRLVRLQNFRNHRDTEIEFGDLTALVGPNSAGKSNVLEGIRCFTQLPDSSTFGDVFRGDQRPEVVVRRGQVLFELRLEGEKGGAPWYIDVRCALEPISGDKAFGGNESYPVLEGESLWEDNRDDRMSLNTVLRDQEVVKNLSGAVYLKAVAKNLSEPSTPQEVPPKLHTNGSGLASVISYLKTTEPDRCERLVRRLQDMVPSVVDLRTRPKLTEQGRGGKNSKRQDELLFDMRGAQGVPAHSVSEGTLVATGLLAAVIGNEEHEPNFLMIDDLEQGLHPKAQRELVGVLRKIQAQQSPLQVVFTTHSPYIVDELEPEEVWVLNTDDEGVAHAHRLSEHPDSKKSLQVLTTGEFWGAEGEEWVVGGDRSSENDKVS